MLCVLDVQAIAGMFSSAGIVERTVDCHTTHTRCLFDTQSTYCRSQELMMVERYTLLLIDAATEDWSVC